MAAESPFNTATTMEEQPAQTTPANDEPFSTAEPSMEEEADSASDSAVESAEPMAAGTSAIEVGEVAETTDAAIEVGAPDELEQAGEVLESFLEVGDLGEEPAQEIPLDNIDTSEPPAETEIGKPPEFAEAGENEGMVEFFVEDDSGQIERVETRATEEQQAPVSKDAPPVTPKPMLTGEETVEMPAMDFSKGALQPDDATVPASEGDTPESEAKKKPSEAGRWRDPRKGGPRRSILPSEQDAKPSSGAIYLVMLILIGAGGLTTNFVDLGTWRFDPVWSVALIFFGLLGFSLQNLSGLYVGGFFTIIHSFGLFSRQQSNLENGVLDGVWHLLVLLAIGFIFLLVYYILMNRKRGHFIIQEGQGQSLTALLLGIVAILTGVLGHLASSTIPNLGSLVFMSTPLRDIAYYSGVALPVIIQSAIAACAMAFGFSANRVSNRAILLAALGILLGAVVLGMLYAPMAFGEFQITLPL